MSEKKSKSKTPISKEITGSRLRPKEKLGRYEIIEHLATGGMAQIYRARSSDRKPYIIKKVLPEYARNEEFIKMFLEEAKISLSLKHPHIVRVTDFGQTDGSYYLAMEYVFGQDLGSLLKKSLEKRSYVPIEVACHIIMQCCLGLDYAHHLNDSFGNSVSIVHRDISPPNVLVSYNGEAKILDFGIAKAIHALQGKQTRSGVLKGKFCYMSPEQARGEALNRQSDLFSIGIVLHELLTTRSLFYTPDEIETLERVRKADVQPPSKWRKDCPKALDKIVLRALQPKLSKRYQSCAEMAQQLHSFLQEYYPRTDHRTVAKLTRQLFRQDFKIRGDVARKENWKDVLVSGAADDDMLLDRTLDSPSSSSISQRSFNITKTEISWWDRLVYDPKTSQKFFKTVKAAAVVLGLGVASIFAWQTGAFKQAYQWSYAQYESISSPSQQDSTNMSSENSSNSTDVATGSFADWMNKTRQAKEKGDYASALHSVEKALRINRFDSSAQREKNFIKIQLGYTKEACEWFQKEPEVTENDRLMARAQCAQASGENQKALLYYNDFMRRFPSDNRVKEIRQVVESIIEKEKN